ncbi:MAG: septum formation initiator family protein [Candidatus Lactobacillus pullistercoris]|uniref:Septum formation initiator family protein n=1 Tax=Candidatus Lactobacillus pullistercoris TaxID=2838636 RepID=A0A9E2NUB6_9LACO|nr:septum formation initiator family protein [Candidatus Lactobacillus pullistercoris]
MSGPRIYNSESPQAREARLRKKQARREKEIHRVRRNKIIAIFAIIFVALGVQIGMKVSQTAKINSQVQASKKTLSKVKAEDNRLKEKRDNLKDPDYVAKFIRNKFFYSKNNEKVYNIPDGDKD